MSGFYDCMHCTSVHVVSPVRMCPASSEAEKWSCTEADLEVGLPGSRCPVENWAWEVLSTVSDFPNYFDLLYLLPISGSGHGYRRDDDTLGEDEERTRNRTVTNG